MARRIRYGAVQYVSLVFKEDVMHTLALLVTLEAKPGKAEELSAFLKSALPLVAQETQTLSWFAFRIGPSKFGIFDTFPDEASRNAHINGEIAAALFAKAEELLATPPQIEKPDIVAAK